MDLQVRPATRDDAQGIIDVLNPIIDARTFTVMDTRLTLGEEQRFLDEYPERGIFHVAVREADQVLVGFQSLEPFARYTRACDHVGVMGTFVDLRLRRQGIGRRLFDTTLPRARTGGYEKIFTFVRADNPGALATYLDQGFSVVGTAHRHTKIDGRYIDETIIEKLLGE
jgi:L-amino acid N-acyltransferase YncA